MKKADAYIVDGDTLREVLLQYDESDVYEESNLDSLEWYEGEREYNDFLRDSILMLIGYTSAKILLKQGKRPKLDRVFRQIDVSTTRQVWNYKPKVDKHISFAYEKGTRDAWKGWRVNTITQLDRHSLYFLKNYNFNQVVGLTHDLQSQIRRSIYEGVAEGKSIPQIARSLREGRGIPPLDVVSKKTGKVIRTIDPQKRATMIARTETMRARNQGLLNNYLQHGINSVMINSAGDTRVCGYCLLAESEGPYEILSGRLPYLPLHPLCRCVYSANIDMLGKYQIESLPTSFANLVTGSVDIVGDIEKFVQ